MILQRAHLAAQRAVRDVEFERRAREAEVPRRRLEHFQLAQRGVLHKRNTEPPNAEFAE